MTRKIRMLEAAMSLHPAYETYRRAIQEQRVLALTQLPKLPPTELARIIASVTECEDCILVWPPISHLGTQGYHYGWCHAIFPYRLSTNHAINRLQDSVSIAESTISVMRCWDPLIPTPNSGSTWILERPTGKVSSCYEYNIYKITGEQTGRTFAVLVRKLDPLKIIEISLSGRDGDVVVRTCYPGPGSCKKYKVTGGRKGIPNWFLLQYDSVATSTTLEGNTTGNTTRRATGNARMGDATKATTNATRKETNITTGTATTMGTARGVAITRGPAGTDGTRR
ncbi:hypothetical protein CHU98_g6982 [Xylaria longipes]|nr:hypothetical protein CHU98_g6982 [Xylaria longipes]